MSHASGSLESVSDIAYEDLVRAHVYRLLARFLSSPPTREDLTQAGSLQGDASPFGEAIGTFARIARGTSPASAADEYHTLFIGLVRGELVPYGSYYLTGFLHEKPLARLRSDLTRLGIERRTDVPEPEDHIAFQCEMMAGLIDGSYGSPLSIAEQKHIFTTHLSGWAPVFFRDLEVSPKALLYAALGSVGRQFMRIEDEAFALA